MGKWYGTFKEYLKEEYEGPYCATDILIRYQGGLVLIGRKYPPYGIAIPGGIAEYMPLPDNAKKEAKEETGLDIILDDPERPFCVLSDPKQDPRAFIASICYTAKGTGIIKPMENEDAKFARKFTLDEIADLLQDEENFAFKHHMKILRKYLKEYRK